MKLIFTLLLSITLNAMTQQEVYSISERYCNNASVIVAISKVESQLGKYKGNHTARGICQLQPIKVRFIATKDNRLRWVENCTDKQLNYVLQNNDHINIMIASIAFSYRVNRYSYDDAIMAHYKFGNKDYLKKVRKEL